MPDVVWTSSLDEKWECKVVRTGEYAGILTVTDGENCIVEEPVTLSYGAIFGPDVDDVAEWQDKCVAAVDAHA